MNPLAQEYFDIEQRPAAQVFRFERGDGVAARGPVVVVREPDTDKPRAFVLPNVLTEEECDELVAAGEAHGIDEKLKDAGSLRTAKRTTAYQNAELSRRLRDRLGREDALTRLDDDDGLGEFSGFHANWRVLRYDPAGDSFPAHQDQMDSYQVVHNDGTKDLVMSSHTMLIHLSESGVTGGATRFYPNAVLNSTAAGQYEGSVDVFLPRGWAVVFRQKGLVHAGQPVTGGRAKYAAQTGVMRLLPPGKLVKPSTFQPGPGLMGASGR